MHRLVAEFWAEERRLETMTVIIELLGLGAVVYWFWPYILLTLMGLFMVDRVLDWLNNRWSS